MAIGTRDPKSEYNKITFNINLGSKHNKNNFLNSEVKIFTVGFENFNKKKLLKFLKIVRIIFIDFVDYFLVILALTIFSVKKHLNL